MVSIDGRGLPGFHGHPQVDRGHLGTQTEESYILREGLKPKQDILNKELNHKHDILT